MTKIVNEFIWLLVNNKAKEVFNSGLFELFILDIDGTEYMATDIQDIDKALAKGLDIGIEVGHLNDFKL